MRLCVVGSGPVARALDEAWRAAGYAVTRRPGREPWMRVDRAFEIVIIAVADRAIADVAAACLAAGAADSSTVILHTAGALAPEEVLAPVRAAVAGVGLLHPLAAIADVVPGQFHDVVFGVAGDAAGRGAAERLVRAIGGRPVFLDGAAPARYHAAAALAANHTLALLATAIQILVDSGVDRPFAERALGRLLQSAARNVERLGLPAALTGPIVRGDVAVVARHLAALPPAAAALYRATGLPTVEIARAAGRADSAALDEIARLLAASSDDNEA